jgi:HK97 gp10 family phage protein
MNEKLFAQLTAMANINLSKAALPGAIIIKDASSENAPVDTGFLRDSHDTAEIEGGAEIQVNADYAGFVEFGTSKMAPQPFLRPAIDDNADAVTIAIAADINKQVKELIK